MFFEEVCEIVLGIEELSLCRRKGLHERVFLVQNLLKGTADEQHLLAVICDHIFAVDHNPVEATPARDDVLYSGHMVAYEDVIALFPREDVVFRTLPYETVDYQVTTSLARALTTSSTPWEVGTTS